MSAGLRRTEQLIAALPPDRPAALLLRHAPRPDWPDRLPDPDTPLTAEGEHQARALGRKLAGRDVVVRTSPTRRCRMTAAIMAQQADAPAPVDDLMLGGPGVFVVDEALASRTWEQAGHARVLQHLCRGVGEWPGLADPARACVALLRHLIGACDRYAASGPLLVFVTHDAVLGPALQRWFVDRVDQQVNWPAYLDAAALWRDNGEICLRYAELLTRLEAPMDPAAALR